MGNMELACFQCLGSQQEVGGSSLGDKAGLPAHTRSLAAGRQPVTDSVNLCEPHRDLVHALDLTLGLNNVDSL